MVITLTRDVSKVGKAGQPVDVDDDAGMKLIRTGYARNAKVSEIQSLERHVTVDEAIREQRSGNDPGFIHQPTVAELTGGSQPERAAYGSAA